MRGSYDAFPRSRFAEEAVKCRHAVQSLVIRERPMILRDAFDRVDSKAFERSAAEQGVGKHTRRSVSSDTAILRT